MIATGIESEKRITLRKAGEIEGVSNKTIKDMIERGEIEGVYFGRRLMTTEGALARAKRSTWRQDDDTNSGIRGVPPVAAGVDHAGGGGV